MTGTVTRAHLEAHALGLRQRLMAGQCPYPDAVMAANEEFLRRLPEVPPGDVVSHAHEVQRGYLDFPGGSTIMSGLAAAGSLLGLTIFAFNAAPVLPHIAIAGFGALGVCGLFNLLGRCREEHKARARFAEHVLAWAQWDKPEPPPILPWQGPLTTNGLQTLAAKFHEGVAPFPYAAEMLDDHERLMQAVSKMGNRPLADVEAELVARSRSAGRTLRHAVGPLLQWAGYGSFITGAAAIAAGHPWLGVGLVGATVGSYVARQLIAPVAGNEPLRQARSLHTWGRAMAAVAPAPPEDLIFGPPVAKKTSPADTTIEKQEEDVQIGQVFVPIKPGTQAVAP